MFGGRILKPGKTVEDYKIVSGCTIHAMDIKPRKCISLEVFWLSLGGPTLLSSSGVNEQTSRGAVRGGLMNNPRMLALVTSPCLSSSS